MKLILAFVLLISSIMVAHAQSVLTQPVDSLRNLRPGYYDCSFLFGEIGFGDSRDPLGNTEPGFYVHSKAHQKWLRIENVSTLNGKFGTSYPDNEADRKTMTMCAVSWDHRALKDKPYAALPLKSSGSIDFPSIELIESTDEYRLTFYGSWGIESVKTVLFIKRKDLFAAFGEVPKKQAAPKHGFGPPLPP